ncbi:Gfo/Idh/MocA family oxidoreductase [Amycolatopsis cynarae]|uniref:Gfo/Idh/MocA family oxidoreductase n=1 Tax=Amycolatopsis cynarae TaxID=2995223 RepID=A0ABY7AUP8_9PSEU|nr:Gfo/Idh/MocA family oxidoreductase [Amycolatopsis sp. HUAS 11-8]WAL63636.1 Gfo/Idh/MocA family oxidoreductase [Amycolatopsis sp. HUAS 11-8]
MTGGALVVGLGSRAELWVRGLAARGRLAAFCDTTGQRMRVHNEWLTEAGYPPVPEYPAGDFPDVLRRVRPETVVVCTPDSTHAGYVVAALGAGCDVVVEKPLATTAEDLRRIFLAERASAGRVRVGFNYRYNPVHAKVKELLASGVIGEIGSVHFEWCLDTHHGADYFRRWHRDKRRSGGLLVHKSAHHFDLVSWWLDAEPVRVFAEGRLFHYRPGTGDGRFALELTDSPRLERLYGGAPGGYRRDLSPFDPGVSIEDDVAVVARFRTGASLTYHLTAYSPWEGYRVSFNGAGGRLELVVQESEWARPGSAQAAARLSGSPDIPPPVSTVTVRPQWNRPYRVELPPVDGAHGGGDVRLLADVLDEPAADPLGRAAGLRDGIRSAVIGLCANESIATGGVVDAAAALRRITGEPVAAPEGRRG